MKSLRVKKITTVKNKESKGIRDTLIKSYEILEEKFNQNEDKINELKAELDGEHQEKKEREEIYSGTGLISNSHG